MTPTKLKQIMKNLGEESLEGLESPSLSAFQFDEKDEAFDWPTNDGLEKAIQNNARAATIAFMAALEPCISKNGLNIYTVTWQSALNYSWKELLEFGGIDDADEYDEAIDSIINSINVARQFWKNEINNGLRK